MEAWADKPARQHRWAIKPAPAEPAAQLVARKDPPVPANQKKPTEKRPPLVASQAPPSRPAPAVQPKPRSASPKPASKPTKKGQKNKDPNQALRRRLERAERTWEEAEAEVLATQAVLADPDLYSD